MAIDPLKIIDKQLEYLQSQSDKNLLTYDQTVQLATLVKAREFIKKAATGIPESDQYDKLTIEELEILVGVLKK